MSELAGLEFGPSSPWSQVSGLWLCLWSRPGQLHRGGTTALPAPPVSSQTRDRSEPELASQLCTLKLGEPARRCSYCPETCSPGVGTRPQLCGHGPLGWSKPPAKVTAHPGFPRNEGIKDVSHSPREEGRRVVCLQHLWPGLGRGCAGPEPGMLLQKPCVHVIEAQYAPATGSTTTPSPSPPPRASTCYSGLF